ASWLLGRFCVSSVRGDRGAVPTRRSSDLPRKLVRGARLARAAASGGDAGGGGAGRPCAAGRADRGGQDAGRLPADAGRPDRPSRSEEHTSELQSRENLVCRLLLEKKNRPS